MMEARGESVLRLFKLFVGLFAENFINKRRKIFIKKKKNRY